MKKESLNNKIEKVVINSGIGRLSQSPNFEEKVLSAILSEIASITGQKPAIRPAKKSIAGFKTREGNVVGVMVTLRHKKMTDFFNRLVNIVIPRVRDFRGIPVDSIDESGNLNIGIRDSGVFPEISGDIGSVSFGMQITIVPRVRGREKAIQLYRELGVPFKK